MKKLFTLFILFLIYQTSYSQIIFGIKSGINFTDISMREGANVYKPKRGIYGGAFAQLDLAKRRLIRAELIYSQKGNITRSETTPWVLTGGPNNFNYINLVLLHGYKPFKNFSILIGPEIGYLAKATAIRGNDKLNVIRINPSQYNRFDLAIDLGLNYKILRHISLETRYSYGFRFMFNDMIGYPPGKKGPTGDGANRVFQIGLNYHFNN